MMPQVIVFRGKNKQICQTDDPDVYLTVFTDEATAYDGLKRRIIPGKGALHCSICTRLFELLEENGVHTHFIGTDGECGMLIRKVEMLPVTVVVRNIAAGAICERLGVARGKQFRVPITEFHMKSDLLGHPMVNESQLEALEILDEDTLDEMRRIALRINALLQHYLFPRGMELIDFRTEFGRDGDRLVVTDELTPATCRLRESGTGEELDMDLFRNEMGDILAAYNDLGRRLLFEECGD